MAVIEELPAEEPARAPVEPDSASIKAEEDQDGDVFYDSSEYPPEELERLTKEASELKRIGNEHFARGDYEKAISEYEDALVNKYKDAREAASSALTLDPGYVKALLRRAQANEKLKSYTGLHDALEDYKKLQAMPGLDAHTKRECERAQQRLPPAIQTQMEKEKEEMMSKLKDLGNTVLGKFGLSTDNFQMQQDPATGGYNLNFVNR
ncbi:hypothetical protein BCR43DRAFT_545821 [Syncephalastrum racemosum]|uniref:Uncharacterized protein n=1 Tax=Syncephalastrum racemosum TaxID=13706 RepID=A0A1X2HEZ9_SYNRA|nr:hypothetical protein BCR43DRAFT_545821 [Syncephalastrum racemosum]